MLMNEVKGIAVKAAANLEDALKAIDAGEGLAGSNTEGNLREAKAIVDGVIGRLTVALERANG